MAQLVNAAILSKQLNVYTEIGTLIAKAYTHDDNVGIRITFMASDDDEKRRQNRPSVCLELTQNDTLHAFIYDYNQDSPVDEYDYITRTASGAQRLADSELESIDTPLGKLPVNTDSMKLLSDAFAAANAELTALKSHKENIE